MEFILTFLIIFLGIGWVLKRLFPILLAWYVKRKIKGEPWIREEEQVRQKKAQEGTVTVEKGAEKEKVIDKNIGEYIDFEEEK